MPICNIKGCGCDGRDKSKKVTLHRLPRNNTRKRQWLNNIGKQNIMKVGRNKEIFVCSLHFEESAINRTLNILKLCDNAVPTIFPWNSNSVSIKQEENAMDDSLSPNIEEEIEEETYYGRCNCCYQTGYLKNLWLPYNTQGKEQIYGDMITECFCISWDKATVSIENDKICEGCILQTILSYEFKKKILDAQKILQKETEKNDDSFQCNEDIVIKSEIIDEDSNVSQNSDDDHDFRDENDDNIHDNDTVLDIKPEIDQDLNVSQNIGDDDESTLDADEFMYFKSADLIESSNDCNCNVCVDDHVLSAPDKTKDIEKHINRCTIYKKPASTPSKPISTIEIVEKNYTVPKIDRLVNKTGESKDNFSSNITNIMEKALNKFTVNNKNIDSNKSVGLTKNRFNLKVYKQSDLNLKSLQKTPISNPKNSTQEVVTKLNSEKHENLKNSPKPQVLKHTNPFEVALEKAVAKAQQFESTFKYIEKPKQKNNEKASTSKDPNEKAKIFEQALEKAIQKAKEIEDDIVTKIFAKPKQNTDQKSTTDPKDNSQVKNNKKTILVSENDSDLESGIDQNIENGDDFQIENLKEESNIELVEDYVMREENDDVNVNIGDGDEAGDRIVYLVMENDHQAPLYNDLHKSSFKRENSMDFQSPVRKRFKSITQELQYVRCISSNKPNILRKSVQRDNAKQ